MDGPFESTQPGAAFPCARCRKSFASAEALHNHQAQCEEQEPSTSEVLRLWQSVRERGLG